MKKITILLALLVLAVALYGCSGAGNGEAVATGDNATANRTAATEDKTPAAENPAEIVLPRI